MPHDNSLLQNEIERQEAEIEELERIAASKQGEIARIAQEYKSALDARNVRAQRPIVEAENHIRLPARRNTRPAAEIHADITRRGGRIRRHRRRPVQGHIGSLAQHPHQVDEHGFCGSCRLDACILAVLK